MEISFQRNGKDVTSDVTSRNKKQENTEQSKSFFNTVTYNLIVIKEQTQNLKNNNNCR